MNIEDFLALPLAPCIRLRIGPGLEEVVEIDQVYFDDHRQELVEWLVSLPDVEGMNWRALKHHTRGNGMMAKVLIALGHLAGVWRQHPLPEAPPELWNREHPRVFQRMVVVPSRVPKPSAGDLDRGVKPCRCCGRPAGPSSSAVHDLTMAEGEDDLCLECWLMECGDGECRLDAPQKTTRKVKVAEAEEEELPQPPPGFFDAYLRQFKG